jgi:hypothetical protein
MRNPSCLRGSFCTFNPAWARLRYPKGLYSRHKERPGQKIVRECKRFLSTKVCRFPKSCLTSIPLAFCARLVFDRASIGRERCEDRPKGNRMSRILGYHCGSKLQFLACRFIHAGAMFDFLLRGMPADIIFEDKALTLVAGVI